MNKIFRSDEHITKIFRPDEPLFRILPGVDGVVLGALPVVHLLLR